MLREQKGITLVALVVTIIVLLILAGVSISLVLGNNGVITRASGSVVANKIGAMREALDMSLASCETDYMSEWTKNTSLERDDNDSGYDNFEKYMEAAGYKTDKTDGLAGTSETDAWGDSGATIKVTDANGSSATFTIKIDKNTGKVTYEKIPTSLD